MALLAEGAAYLYKHDFERASLNYRTVWADDNVLAFAKFYHTQGKGLRATPLREDLIKGLKQKVKAKPADSDSIYLIATLDMEFGRWQEAAEMYQRFFEVTKQPMPPSLKQILDIVTGK